MKKYTITEGEYDLMCAKVQSLENENNRLKGYIEGLTEQLRIGGVSCSSDGCYECGSNNLRPKEYNCLDCGHDGYCY